MPLYFAARAESGSAISKENPSLVVGDVGGCGSSKAGFFPLFEADLVSAPIGTFVTTGGSQAHCASAAFLSALIGAIAASQRLSPYAFYGISMTMARLVLAGNISR